MFNIHKFTSLILEKPITYFPNFLPAWEIKKLNIRDFLPT